MVALNEVQSGESRAQFVLASVRHFTERKPDLGGHDSCEGEGVFDGHRVWLYEQIPEQAVEPPVRG